MSKQSNDKKVYSELETRHTSYYEILRNKWSDRQTINNIENKDDTDYRANMAKLTDRATILWNDMNKETEREDLWPKYTTAIETSHITSTVRDLKILTMAYKSTGSDLYNDAALGEDIRLALDWLYAKRYNENIKIYKNWWDWDIGIPQSLNDIFVMMYDELSKKQLENYIRALNHYVPTPMTALGGPNPLTGANLLDTALVFAIRGLLEESSKCITEATDAINEVLPYVTKGDGFYEDGSFIQHRTIPYAGGYGGVLMSSLEQILFITDSTPWKVTNPLIEHVYDWIINAFEPLYYRGAIMDMVSGRGISREYSNDRDKGKGLLHKMLALAETAPEQKKIHIRSFIKENIIRDVYCKEDYFERVNINDVIALKKLVTDEAIPIRGDLSLYKVYGAMDRVVHHRPGFTFGISMFSTRISAYEIGNGENKKPWHTADGMVYLYNDDGDQYSNNYWPTVDMMRLPGITTDHSERTLKNWVDYKSSKTWVGGASIQNLYGTSGMEFEMEAGKSNLTGKKSWFNFDEEMVALGSSINAIGNEIVETIVENRKIKDIGDNKLIVNGIDQPNKLNWSEEIANATWALLEGNTQNGSDAIGYYFPGNTTITVKREARTGSWNDINDSGSKQPITKNYVSLAIEHGNKPKNATYSYVVLPNKTEKQVVAYSENPDVVILSNNEQVQAVRKTKLAVLGANFWSKGSVEYITAMNPCSIMINENPDEFIVGISDPTHLTSEVMVELEKLNYKVIEQDSTVSIEETETGIKIRVNTNQSMGKTHYLKLSQLKN